MIIGVGGPASMIGFDYSKESFKPQELGAVNGLINVGAFIAALIMMGVIGSVIDVLGGPKLDSLDNFRIAFLAQLLVSGFGIAGLLVSRRMMRNNRGTKQLPSKC
jgi:MFS family permease